MRKLNDEARGQLYLFLTSAIDYADLRKKKLEAEVRWGISKTFINRFVREECYNLSHIRQMVEENELAGSVDLEEFERWYFKRKPNGKHIPLMEVAKGLKISLSKLYDVVHMHGYERVANPGKEERLEKAIRAYVETNDKVRDILAEYQLNPNELYMELDKRGHAKRKE